MVVSSPLCLLQAQFLCCARSCTSLGEEEMGEMGGGCTGEPHQHLLGTPCGEEERE